LGSYSWDGKMVMFDLSEGTQNNKAYLYDEVEVKNLINDLECELENY